METNADEVRSTVRKLAEHGPLANEREWIMDPLKHLENVIYSIIPPLNLPEAGALLVLFDRESEDDLYGLIWTIVALIETAPGWPPDSLGPLAKPDRPWYVILRDRAARAGRAR
jgi:hypothetical protein